MQVLKEKKALGIRYFGRIGILIINAILVLIFLNIAMWLKELFSNVYQMDSMDKMLENHAYFDKQMKGMGIVMILIGSIPSAAFFLMLCTFITSVLKTRETEEYLLYCLGYTKVQLIGRELIYILFDTLVVYAIAAILFPVIMNQIIKSKYIMMLQESFHTDLEIYYSMYVVFFSILVVIVVYKGMQIIKNNLKMLRR